MPSTHVHLVIVIDNATDQYLLYFKSSLSEKKLFHVRHLKPFLHKTGLIKKLFHLDLPFYSENLVIYLQKKKTFNTNKSFSYSLMVLHINMPLQASFLQACFQKD